MCCCSGGTASGAPFICQMNELKEAGVLGLSWLIILAGEGADG